MSTLLLPKTYGDLELLFVSDIHDMWTALETFTNGGITDDNVAANFASWNQVTIEKDVNVYMGTTLSAYVRYLSDTDQFVFCHVAEDTDTIFKIAGTEIARIDDDKNFSFKKDIYFYNCCTDYSLTRLVGNYTKPILMYVDSDTVTLENNTEYAHESLVVFQTGPINLTENIATTDKHRHLKLSATANGYANGHTGDADSGLRVGLTLAANTWYFVYAVRVQYGTDAGNKFILVADTTNPSNTNWSTLDTRFGAGEWLYIGCIRYGHGGAATTTLVPFMYDHQGWCSFIGRAATSDFFGIRVGSASVTSTSLATLATFTAADSGNYAPATVSAIKVECRVVCDADDDMGGYLEFTDSSDATLFTWASFANNLAGDEAHGWQAKIANGQGIKLKAKRASSSADDFESKTYISGFLDEAM